MATRFAPAAADSIVRNWTLEPPPWIAVRLCEVEQRITDALATPPAGIARDAGQLLHHAGGKRLRPAILLAAAQLGRGGGDGPVRAAAGVELLHLASIHHDDVIDQAGLRRGKPSVNALWGNAAATLAGTMIFALALVELGGLDDACNVWASEAAARLRAGQTRECERLHDTGLTVSQYVEIIGGKTAALFALSCQLGGHLGGLAAEQVAALQIYGERLGLAFQIMDDITDLVGASQDTGKSPHADLMAGVYTLPTIFCLAGDDHAGRGLRDLLKRGALGADEIEVAIDHILASSALAQCRLMLETLAQQAREALVGFPAGPARDWLSWLTRAVVGEAPGS